MTRKKSRDEVIRGYVEKFWSMNSQEPQEEFEQEKGMSTFVFLEDASGSQGSCVGTDRKGQGHQPGGLAIVRVKITGTLIGVGADSGGM